MRAFACLFLGLCCAAIAQETDRPAIERTIANLNDSVRRNAQFTPDADGRAELDAALRPTTAIPHSDQPMSEQWPFPPSSARVRCTRVRLLTADVALADGVAGPHQLLFVMKKADGAWKIASVRFLKDQKEPLKEK
ncbi:MAG TPA: hypothetical protein VN736_21200 [Candidatus Limnocylindrales bacterium]|nr:hypothetical protein [Candidatus Limnocylindrales bacterium]